MTNNHVNQNISGNGNNTSLNIAGGDAISNITVASTDIDDLVGQLENLKKLVSRDDFKDLNNEETLDDIEAIQEQLKSDNPKQQRIKSAIERIKQYASNIPMAVEGAKLVVDNITNIYNKISQLFS